MRIAVCGELSGQGLMLDDATYAVLHGDSVNMFDLTSSPREMDELVVDGDGWNYYANQTFIAEHPDIAIVSDPGKNAEDNERYLDRMLSGKAAGDVVALEQDPRDPDPSGATQGIALQDPDLLDSIVKDMQISAERKRCLQQYLGTGMPRYVRWLRQPAFDPMRHRIVQTGFTS